MPVPTPRPGGRWRIGHRSLSCDATSPTSTRRDVHDRAAATRAAIISRGPSAAPGRPSTRSCRRPCSRWCALIRNRYGKTTAVYGCDLRILQGVEEAIERVISDVHRYSEAGERLAERLRVQSQWNQDDIERLQAGATLMESVRSTDSAARSRELTAILADFEEARRAIRASVVAAAAGRRGHGQRDRRDLRRVPAAGQPTREGPPDPRAGPDRIRAPAACISPAAATPADPLRVRSSAATAGWWARWPGPDGRIGRHSSSEEPVRAPMIGGEDPPGAAGSSAPSSGNVSTPAFHGRT